MTIQAKQTNRYGTNVLKPIDEIGTNFLSALGKKEFTRETILALESLGIKLEII
jgi:hypothetical protein